MSTVLLTIKFLKFRLISSSLTLKIECQNVFLIIDNLEQGDLTCVLQKQRTKKILKKEKKFVNMQTKIKLKNTVNP